MLNMHQIGFALLFIFTSNLWAKSHASIEMPQNVLEQTNNIAKLQLKSNTEYELLNNGNKQNYNTNTIIESQKHEVQVDEETKKRNEKYKLFYELTKSHFIGWSWTDSLLFAFILFLVYVGIRQNKLIYILEMPIPSVVGIKLVAYVDESSPMTLPDPVPPGPIPDFCRVLIGIHNSGRTPMRITKFSIEWMIAPTLQQESKCTHFEEWNSLILPNQGSWVMATTMGDIRPTAVQHQTIINRQEYLWVFGFFRYSDFKGKSFDTGFLARWDINQGFVREPNKSYEYQRES